MSPLIHLFNSTPFFFQTIFQSKEGKSPLHMAAIHGRFTRSQILIQNGKPDWDKCAGLPFFLLLSRLLFDCSCWPSYSPPGGEIDCVDKYGNTPLHVAAKYGHELLISTLMTNGADTARYRIFQSTLIVLPGIALPDFHCSKLYLKQIVHLLQF